MDSRNLEKNSRINKGLSKEELLDTCKREERALEDALKREKTLKTVINNSPVIVFLWKYEEKWPVEYVSENVIQFGYTAEDFVSGGLLYGDIIHPEDLKRVEEELDRQTREGAVDFNIEYRILAKAGNTRWVSERTFIQRDATGEITHYQGIILDVTAKKENEEALKKALEEVEVLNTVINNSPAVVFLWKNEKKWPAVFVSENIVQFGYTSQDFLSENVLYGEILHPDDFERVIKELSRCIKEGYNDFMMEYRLFTKDGKLRWVDERTFIQRDPKGEATHLQGIVVDVTARKEAEQLLEIERALGTSLSSTWSLQTMLEEVLNACFQVEGIDSGGIYLVDELVDKINLVAHRGFSTEFVEKVSTFEAGSSEARQITREKPSYKLSFFSEKLLGEALGEEGLRGVAVIPLKYKGEIIGSLNLASHNMEEFAPNIRTFLETIALQAVNYIAPIRIEADLA